MNIKHLYSTLALIIICLIQPNVVEAQLGGFFGRGPKIDVIETEELKALLEKQQHEEAAAKEAGKEAPPADFVLVDVRTDAEVKVSVIPGAITKAQYEKDLSQYQDRTVIPYCTVGGRSGSYAKQLVGKGVKVRNYQGSILEWVGAELPLVTLDGKPTNRVHTYSSRYRVPAGYQQVTQ